MDLKQKLSQVPKLLQNQFLRKKLRELKLLYKVDKITDQCRDLNSLVGKTLKVALKFFRCQTAALLFTDKKARHRQFFLGLGIPQGAQNSSLTIALQDFLHQSTTDSDQGHIHNPAPESLFAVGLKNLSVASFSVSERLGGALLIGNRDSEFDEEDLHYLEAIISQIDNGIEHGYMLQKFQKSRKQAKKESKKLDFVYEISLSLGREEDFTSLAKRILESAMQLVEVNRCSFMLYDPEKDELKTDFVLGLPFKKSNMRFKLGEGIAGAALKAGKPILTQKGDSDSRFVPFNEKVGEFPGILNLACLPMIVDGYPLGVLNFSSSDPNFSVTPDELSALEVVASLICLAWQRQNLYQMSIKDELTDLYSFRFLKQRLREEVNRTRYLTGVEFSLILFDIDFFKMFNDTFGHLAGNEVLKQFANTLRNAIRNGVDIPARFGGEEFALLLPGTSRENALVVAERVRSTLEKSTVDFEGEILKVTVSGGVSSYCGTQTVDDLIQEADESLYKAKENGRNQLHLCPRTPADNPSKTG